METDARQGRVMGDRDFPSSRERPGRFISRLPRRFVIRVGGALGYLAFILDWRHRRIVRRNLRFVYPEWTEKRVRAVSRDVFKNAFRTALEIFQIQFSSSEDILQKVRVYGEENFQAASKMSPGILVISAHLGNWEIAGLIPPLRFHLPSAFVARELNSKFLDRFLNKARTSFGNIIIDKKGALPKMVRLLHRGWLVGVLMDQGTNRTEGVECTFFGKKVYTTPVASLLARRYNYPVVPGYCSRGKDGLFSVVFKPPLRLVKTNNAEADVQVNTQLMNDALEECIRECPEQYFWFHKRWKRHYPHLYPEDLARKKRIRERRGQRRARAES